MTPEKAMTLSNITVPEIILQGKDKTEFEWRFNAPLAAIVWKMATENPRLEFIAECRNVDTGILRVNGFNVCIDGRKVGSISTAYTNSDRCFELRSDILSAERSRGGAYRTKDAKKALAAIKKAFVPKSIATIVSEAFDMARNIVNTQSYRKNGLVHSERASLDAAISAYVFEDSLDTFKSYLGAKFPEKLYALDKLAQYQSEMVTVDQIRGALDGKRTYLVLIDRAKYIVSKDDTVNVYDDTSLPEVLRCKLGMLKLVEPEQMIENIGCRASKDVFVLVDETVAL